MTRKNQFLVTIDGPAASGKTTVSRLTAKELGWSWVSTGAFYRGLAYFATREDVEWTDVKGLVGLISSPHWSVEMTSDETRVMVRGENVTSQIHEEKMGTGASQVSLYPEVRA